MYCGFYKVTADCGCMNNNDKRILINSELLKGKACQVDCQSAFCQLQSAVSDSTFSF